MNSVAFVTEAQTTSWVISVDESPRAIVSSRCSIVHIRCKVCPKYSSFSLPIATYSSSSLPFATYFPLQPITMRARSNSTTSTSSSSSESGYLSSTSTSSSDSSGISTLPSKTGSTLSLAKDCDVELPVPFFPATLVTNLEAKYNARSLPQSLPLPPLPEVDVIRTTDSQDK